ncbi:MAG: bifunctional diguanylate cyclase/phosphodiesterase [Ilumatobacteraceae bacterium]
MITERLLTTAATNEPARFECRINLANGVRVLDCTISNHQDDDGAAGMVLNAIDVTDRATLQATLSYQATHDSLTGLLNRSAFVEHVGERLAAGVNVAVLLIDLDGFKEVNDTLGHEAGDQVLTMRQRFATLVREGDLVSRLGGDEFAVLCALPGDDRCPGRGPPDPRLPGGADRDPRHRGVRDRERRHRVRRGRTRCAHAPEARRLRHVRREGERTSSLRDVRARARRSLRSSDRDARLDREGVEQPRVRAAVPTDPRSRQHCAHRLRGAAALAPARRLLHESGGLLPIAESSGQIVPLGRWIVHAALRQLGVWRQINPQLGMAINVSPRQLGEEGFVSEVAALLDTHGIPPQAVTFEVTEACSSRIPSGPRSASAS